MSTTKDKVIELMNAGKIAGFNYKEVKTVYTFTDGREETATFCLNIDPTHPNNVEIYRVVAEHSQQMFEHYGATKAVTTAKFV